MLKDMSLALLLRIAGTLAWLLLTVAMARTLPQAAFGSAMYILNLLLLLVPFATLGMVTSSLRFGSIYWSRNSVGDFSRLTSQSMLIAVFGSVLTILAILTAWHLQLLPRGLPDALVFWSLPAIILSAIMAVNQNLIRGMGKIVGALLGFSVVRPLVPLILYLAVAAFCDVNAVVAISLVVLGLLVGVIHQAVLLLRSGVRGRYGLGHPGKHLSVALGVWPAEIASVMSVRIGGVVVGSMLGVKAVALYLAADRVAALAQFLLDAARVACAPHIARAAEGERDCEGQGQSESQGQSEIEEKGQGAQSLQEVVADTSLLMLLSGLAGCAGVAAIAYPALLLLGPEYGEGFSIVLVLVAGYLSWAICGPVGIVLTMSGHERISSYVAVLGGIGAFALSWLAAGQVGMLGVAVVFALVSWLTNIAMAVAVKQARGVNVGLLAIDRAAWRRLQRTLSSAMKRYGIGGKAPNGK